MATSLRACGHVDRFLATKEGMNRFHDWHRELPRSSPRDPGMTQRAGIWMADGWVAGTCVDFGACCCRKIEVRQAPGIGQGRGTRVSEANPLEECSPTRCRSRNSRERQLGSDQPADPYTPFWRRPPEFWPTHSGGRPTLRYRMAPWSRDPQVFRPAALPDQTQRSGQVLEPYVYQFSHEFCHVMTNFDRHKGHKHRWFDGAANSLRCSCSIVWPNSGKRSHRRPFPTCRIRDRCWNHRRCTRSAPQHDIRISRDLLPEWFATGERVVPN